MSVYPSSSISAALKMRTGNGAELSGVENLNGPANPIPNRHG